MTTYMIFKCEDLKWEHISNQEASSTKRALSSATLDGPGKYVAIPARSFKPLEVKVEQTTKITIG